MPWPSTDPHLTWTWTWAWQKCRSKLVKKTRSLLVPTTSFSQDDVICDMTQMRKSLTHSSLQSLQSSMLMYRISSRTPLGKKPQEVKRAIDTTKMFQEGELGKVGGMKNEQPSRSCTASPLHWYGPAWRLSTSSCSCWIGNEEGLQQSCSKEW